MGSNHILLLQEWLSRHGLTSETDALASLLVRNGRTSQAALLRWLNRIESRFDSLIGALEGDVPLDWGTIRHELALLPDPSSPLSDLPQVLRALLAAGPYSSEQLARAERLWQDFLFLQEGQVRPLQVPAGWAAAVEYVLQKLYFLGDSTQEQISLRHGVSISTMGLRYRALIEALDIQLFDTPARKRLLAWHALTIEGAGMSENEFNRRLLEGGMDAATSGLSLPKQT